MVHMFNLFTARDLDEAIDHKWIKVRESDDGELRIFNYSDKAMIDNAWHNPAVLHCRGLIVDKFGYVVARAWKKFFNLSQVDSLEIDLEAPVEVTDKADGSLGILHSTRDGIKVATRGSFNSSQAVHATEVLGNMEFTWVPGLTPLVEIVFPENHIVLDYGDKDTLILLGAVWTDSGKYLGPQEAADLLSWRGDVVETFTLATMKEALSLEHRKDTEGYVVRRLDKPWQVKLKSEDYVARHKMIFGLSAKTVWEMMMEGKSQDEILDGLPDELYPWVKTTWNGFMESVDATLVQVAVAKSEIESSVLDKSSRKEYAIAASKFPGLMPYLMADLDGKLDQRMVLKKLRPFGENRARVTNEDVA